MSELEILKCPSCGASVDLDEKQEYGFCKYCGSKVIKKSSIVQKVEVTNPVKIDGRINIVNNEFEAQLAKVDHMAQKFLNIRNKSKSKVFQKITEYTEDDIINAYKRLENIGAHEAKLWEHLMEFYVKANMYDNVIYTTSVSEFEDTVNDIYSMIIKYEEDEEILDEIDEDYEPQKVVKQFKEKMKKISAYDLFDKKHPQASAVLTILIGLGIEALIILGLYLSSKS